MKFVVLCNRHDSIYGDKFALFWGCGETSQGYSSDIRLAHRFDESEIVDFDDNADIPISCNSISISEEQENNLTINQNIRCLIEKSTIQQLLPNLIIK